METTDLIHKLEKARTKDELETLGIDHLGVNVDKRKAKEVLRAELLGEAELRAGQPPVENAVPDKLQPDAAQPPVEETAPETDQPPEEDPDDEGDQAPETRSGYPGRLMRHRKTGRVMPWTAAIAKMPHMEEM